MIEEIITRNCPKCNKKLKYGNKYSRHNAELIKSVCGTCSRTKFIKDDLVRKCPKCEKLISYTLSSDKRRAEKANTSCLKCTDSINRFKKGVGCLIKGEHSIPKYNLDFLFNDDFISYYFLGLIIADGSFYKNRFEITLKEEDSYILEELSTLTKGSPIVSKFVKGKEYKKLTFNNKDSVYKVMDYFGFNYNKTYNPINFIDLPITEYNFLFSTFIGILDGDGSFYINKKSNKNPYIALTFHKNWENFYTKMFEKLNIFYSVKYCNNCIVFSISRTIELIKIRDLKNALGIKGIKRKWNKIDNVKIDEKIKNSYRV